MKLKKTRFFIIFSLLFLSLPAHATSLDEIYRDLVRSDNSGYLPMFVKNRNAPDFLLDDEAAKQIMPPKETKTIDMKAVNLESERLKRAQGCASEMAEYFACRQKQSCHAGRVGRNPKTCQQ